MPCGVVFRHAAIAWRLRVGMMLLGLHLGPGLGPRGKAHVGIAMSNGASGRCFVASFLARRKCEVEVLHCEIYHTSGSGSKTGAAVGLVDQCEICIIEMKFLHYVLLLLGWWIRSGNDHPPIR